MVKTLTTITAATLCLFLSSCFEKAENANTESKPSTEEKSTEGQTKATDAGEEKKDESKKKT